MAFQDFIESNKERRRSASVGHTRASVRHTWLSVRHVLDTPGRVLGTCLDEGRELGALAADCRQLRVLDDVRARLRPERVVPDIWFYFEF